MNAPLTQQLIHQAQESLPDGERVELSDVDEPGLRLRISEGTAKWSLLTYVNGAIRVRLPLGEWPALDVEGARASARAVKAQIDGQDPEGPGPLTVSLLLQQYSRKRLSQLKRGEDARRALERALAPLKHRDVSTINRRDIVAAVDEVADRAPIYANRTLAYSKAFFAWAVGRGYLERNPAAGIPKLVREVSRDRTPTVSELAEIWEASHVLGYPFGHVVRLLMLTAARRDEVGALQLSELDLPKGEAEGCWTLPATRSKNGRAIRMPLSPAARRDVEAAWKARRERQALGPYLFTTRGSAVSGWSKAKARLDQAIADARHAAGVIGEMPPWRLHDLRRGFATAACDVLHIDPAVADRCLNHVGAATTSTIARVYGRNEMFDQRKDALTRWAELLEIEIERRRAGRQAA